MGWGEIILSVIGLFILAEGLTRLGEWLMGGFDGLVRRRLDKVFGEDRAPVLPEPDQVDSIRRRGGL